MTKLSFEDWKNSDEVSYNLPDELIADTGWAKAQSKSPEELKDTPTKEFVMGEIEQLIRDELLEEIRNSNPETYKVVQDYINQNVIQRFFQMIKWGFIACLSNFRYWKGHMTTEYDWCFWEILNGDWSDYE